MISTRVFLLGESSFGVDGPRGAIGLAPELCRAPGGLAKAGRVSGPSPAAEDLRGFGMRLECRANYLYMVGE